LNHRCCPKPNATFRTGLNKHEWFECINQLFSAKIASKAPDGFSLSIFLDQKIDINPIKYVHSLKIPGACSIKLIRP